MYYPLILMKQWRLTNCVLGLPNLKVLKDKRHYQDVREEG